MFRILLVDKDQSVVADERFTFTRINPNDAILSHVCGHVRLAAITLPSYDLITLVHGGGTLGFALTCAIPPDQRDRIVILSKNPVPPFMQDGYTLLGVSTFSGREDEYARFMNEWAARQRALEPPTDP